MTVYELQTPREIALELGSKARRLRLDRNLSQAEVAARADVSLRTLQRFERQGQATLQAVLQIAFALGAEAGFAALFPGLDPRTIDEVLAQRRPGRQRARGTR